MSISDKLTQIANNVPLVYDAGYEKGKAEGGDSENLKEVISCGMLFDFRNYAKEKLVAESDLALSYTTELTHGSSTAPKGICSNNQNLKECKLIFLNATNARFSFYDCHNLEYLTVDMTKVVDATGGYSGFNSTFRYCYALKRIDGQISLLNCNPENTFGGCNALEYVAFLPNSINKSLSLSDSSNFSAEGIQTLINALMPITDGVPRTLTIHQTVRDNLTQNQELTITGTVEQGGKGWTLSPARTVTAE